MMQKKLKIGVALVAKNEEESIAYMIDKLRKSGYDDIYVVDEQSKDKTKEIAESLGIAVYQREGKGFGCGIKSALKIAAAKGYDYMIRLDCDGSYPPEELSKLIGYAEHYDLIAGIRDIKKIKWLHRLPNRFHTILTNILFNGRLKDINSGMKLINVKKFNGILEADGFDMEAELSLKALKRKYSIKEVPIDFKDRYGGESKIRISD
ncbi:glycosyltransferase family 2 protein, partial [Candidatus Woesearchaeota archaeon]|nr:glycosyltransferase family 2 protein [Candidatus Woesearchaeota archaeon]